MKNTLCSLLLLLATMVCLPAGGQTPAAKLTVDQVVNGRLFPVKGMGPMSWLRDGEGYSRLEADPVTGGTSIVRYEAADNRRSVLVPASLLTDPATGAALPVYGYSWSGDNNKLLIFNNTRKVWRYHTRGDYWVLDLATGHLHRLGKGLPEASLMFAKFSPDATRVAYVCRNDIYVEDLASGRILRLTTDGSDHIVNGTFDWVYEEEFNCRDGFRWSSDGQYIAYWQSDTEGTGVFYLIDNVDSVYSRPIALPYPKAGTTNSAVRVGYIPAAGGETQWIDLPGDPRNHYIPRMEFIPGTNELFIQQMNRLQNTNKVWIAPIGGSPENIFTDTDAAWVDVNDDIQWLKNNRYFTWLSDRDGYKHVYLVSRDGKECRRVTAGDIDIASVVGTDLQKGYVYYIASPDNYTQRYLYRSSYFGDGRMERVTPAGQEGQHRYHISPTGKWAVHTFENAVTPPVISMVALPSHRTRRIIEDNKAAKQAYDAWGFRPKEFVRADIGNVVLDAWIIKPRDFDPAKKYPVIVEVYGEPANSTVQDNWSGGSLWPQYLANEGYIYVSIDNRGAKVPRGREWRKCIYGQIGILASHDQAAGIRALARSYPFIDTTRIGITGWSGGGSMTLNCMFRYPELYRTGIAVAFVSLQKLYDTIYQERFMGTPDSNPDGYREGSPLTHAHNLQGNLLLIHGTGDDNVHYQSCEMLVDELVRHGKMFYMLSYPMRTHSIDEGEGTTYHLRLSMDKFWKENLRPGGE